MHNFYYYAPTLVYIFVYNTIMHLQGTMAAISGMYCTNEARELGVIAEGVHRQINAQGVRETGGTCIACMINPSEKHALILQAETARTP